MTTKVTWYQRSLPPLVPLLLLLPAIELAVHRGWIAAYLVAPPSAVLAAMQSERHELLQGFYETFTAATVGLLLSLASGVLFAVLLSLSEIFRRAFQPYAVFFQTVPIVAIAPLLVIWFGFGQSTVIASAFIVSLFPIIASTLLGLQSTDPQLMDLFTLHRASRLDLYLRLKIPFALPLILSGLRISSGLAVIGAIVGEFIAGGGLGSVIDAARTRQRIDIVFAAVLISSLLGLMMVSAIDFITWLCLRNWHASVRKTS